MDNVTHSLVGLTIAKAGLERVSPYATTVCVVSANIADADFAYLVFGDRWTWLDHHRGITHSIIGTVAIGLLIPILAWAIERLVSVISQRRSRIRFGGLLVASMIAAATHPFLDWTNNYGLRPFLPWSGQWIYGDLVYIVDPYIWLLLGATAFLLTSQTKLKIALWCLVAAGATLVMALAAHTGVPESTPLRIALIVWIVVGSAIAVMRAYGVHKRIGARAAIVALALLLGYWGLLEVTHRVALANAHAVADNLASRHGEHLLRAAAMPNAATAFRWQSVAETDQAFYKFTVGLKGSDESEMAGDVVRWPKPTGQKEILINLAKEDRRAQILLAFARFPIADTDGSNCVGQTLVQFADLRYTEPGRGRANFSVNIPVDCPSR
jgi:inner membrane protein